MYHRSSYYFLRIIIMMIMKTKYYCIVKVKDSVTGTNVLGLCLLEKDNEVALQHKMVILLT